MTANTKYISVNQEEDARASMEAPIKPLIPFVHKFRTSTTKYIFDINTNRVLRVLPVTWDIVEEFGVLNKDNIIGKYLSKYKPAEISSAYDEIAYAQQHDNLLLSKPPTKLLDSEIFADGMREILEHRRLLLTLCVSEECNFRCTYCTYGDWYPSWRKHSKRKMSWEVARLAIDDYILHSDARDTSLSSKRNIGFYGGEPLLNFPIIKQCVAYTREKLGNEVTFTVTTNGSLLRGRIAEFLASEGFNILISLDGPRHIHDYHRRFADGSPTWKLVMKNIKHFVEQYPEFKEDRPEGHGLGFSVVLSPLLNALDVEKFFRSELPNILQFNAIRPSVSLMEEIGSNYIDSLAFEDRRVPGWETLRKKYLGEVVSGAVCQSPDEREWRFRRRLFDSFFWRFLKRKVASAKQPILQSRGIWTAMCNPGQSRCFVTPDGNYYLCERVPCSAEFKIGNVWEGINVSAAFSLKKKVFKLCKDECKDCWCLNFCCVGCFSNIRDGARITAESIRRECKKNRDGTHRMLENYFEIIEANPHAFDHLKEAARFQEGLKKGGAD